LAAHRAHITELILPAQNEKNVIEDIQPELLKELKIHYVKTMEEVLSLAFLRPVLGVMADTQPVQQAI
jgi:ATP-dependent Lon protease